MKGEIIMPRAYSMDLRSRIIREVGGGMSARRAAAKYHVSVSFAIKLVRRWRETGDYSPKKMGGYFRSPLEAHQELLFGWVEQDKGITLNEIKDRLRERGISTGIGSLWRFFDRHDYSYKKNSARKRARA